MKYLKLYEDFVSETMQFAVLKHQADIESKRKEEREKRRKDQNVKEPSKTDVTDEEEVGETEAESDEIETGAQMEPEQFDIDMGTEGSSEEETYGY